MRKVVDEDNVFGNVEMLINQLSNKLYKDGFKGHVELKENGFIIVQGKLKKGKVYGFYAQVIDLGIVGITTISNNIVKIFEMLNENNSEVDKDIINNILEDMVVITFDNTILFSQEYINKYGKEV